MYPIYQIKRTYDDFWAFHEALRSKFRHVKFQELPKQPTSLSLFNKTTHEDRIKQFQKLFDQILNDAGQHEVLRPRMLAMLYVFLIKEANILQKDQKEEKREGTSANRQGQQANNGEQQFEEAPGQAPHFNELEARMIRQRNKKNKPYFSQKQIKSLQVEFREAQKFQQKHRRVNPRAEEMDDDGSMGESLLVRRQSSFDTGDHNRSNPTRAQNHSNSPSKGLLDYRPLVTAAGRRSVSGLRSPAVRANPKRVQLTNSNGNRRASARYTPGGSTREHSERKIQKYKNSLFLMRKDFEEQFRRNMDQVTIDTLGKVFVQLPQVQDLKGTEIDEDQNQGQKRSAKANYYQQNGGWQSFHAKFENHCQLQFLQNIEEESFSINYLMNRCMTKHVTVEVSDEKTKLTREIDALQIFHKFDTKPIVITAP